MDDPSALPPSAELISEVLGRVRADWEPRLREQLDELTAKLDRSVERLTVSAEREGDRVHHRI
ncbi:MAG: hypothetical protein EOO75_11905, partial [Myxococcales bacterium]